MSPSFDNSSSKRAKTEKRNLDNYVSVTTTEQREKFDEQVGRFFYATNSAFRMVEHPKFIKLLQLLRPGYKLQIGN